VDGDRHNEAEEKKENGKSTGRRTSFLGKVQRELQGSHAQGSLQKKNHNGRRIKDRNGEGAVAKRLPGVEEEPVSRLNPG